MVYTLDNQPQQSLSPRAAKKLACTIKSPPQMRAISPRWLLLLLPWVEVSGGTYRVNRRDVRISEGVAANDDGEKNIDILSGHEGEPTLTQTFVDYDDDPPEYPLRVAQTIVRVHTRVSDLYSNARDQLQEQLRLTIEALRERKEWEIVNNDGNGDPDRAFGLLHEADPSMRLSTRTGPPTPDDFDELLAKVWKQPAFFLAHPKAIAAFGRECTRRGIPPATVNLFGSPFITWRGVPIIASNKLAVSSEGKTNILLMRVGEAQQGVVGLRKTGLIGEHAEIPGVSVRLMGIDQKASASYLVTLYFSAAVLVPDALGVLENVEVGRYYDEDANSRKRPAANVGKNADQSASPSVSSVSAPQTAPPSEPVKETAKTSTLWQLGKPGGGKPGRAGREFLRAGQWQAEFNYTVGSDPDPINQPSLPAILTRPSLKRKPKRKGQPQASTDKLNIRFTLDNSYAEGQLVLFYDFFGSETDSIFLDGTLVTKIPGVGEGKLKKCQIPLGAVTSGDHVLTITTDGGNGYHWFDYLKLQAIAP